MENEEKKESGQNVQQNVQIRAALTSPVTLQRIPGYFLIMSLEGDRLKFLAEYQDINPRNLILNLIAFEDEYRYHAIYTTVNQVQKLTDMFFVNMYRACRESIPWVRITPAPYADDVNSGINLFANYTYGGQFDPPPVDSTLNAQLQTIQAAVEPDESFYAFHALRYILGGLAIHPNIDPSTIAESRERYLEVKKAVDLTGMSKAAHDLIQRIRKEQKDNQERYDNYDECY